MSFGDLDFRELKLLAAHNAAPECYRRAMIREQTFEGRRESLIQASKLSRTSAVLLDALNRHRVKGQQKVTVEHVSRARWRPSSRGHDRKSPAKYSLIERETKRTNAKQIGHAPQPAMRRAD
jgi:hypothetical protein